MKPRWLENDQTYRRSGELMRDGRWGGERAFFQARRMRFIDCTFEAGESALKESADIQARRCTFEGKYPLWHTTRVAATDCAFTPGSRAGIWYSQTLRFTRCHLDAPKLLRDCKDLVLESCTFGDSFETGWNSSQVTLRDCQLRGAYLFMHARDIAVEHCVIDGHYAFQYVRNAVVSRCVIKSKDVFWHAEDLWVEDCSIATNYLAWHARNITFVRCALNGPQPLCYGSRVSLRGCTLDDAERAFEFSHVDAEIDGHVDSVLNPASGQIVADSIGVLLQDDPRLDHGAVAIKTRIGPNRVA